ncbi:MAG: YciI family protein [Kofleriaceae bacterium]|nr:YciI family protein [Kofleriaceae bacterium]
MRIALLSLVLAACASTAAPKPATNGGYDAARAKRLGADEYGMKTYVIAFLYRGPNRPADPEESKRLMRAHLDNIGRLAAAGTLMVAGPMQDDTDLRGIYVFDVATIAEAEALTKTDPAIAYGSLRMELHPWYGSAALGEVPAIHEAIARTKI